MGKRAKYVVLKNREDLTEEQESILKRILTACPSLKTCYELKESFISIFNSSENREIGRANLSAWILNVI